MQRVVNAVKQSLAFVVSISHWLFVSYEGSKSLSLVSWYISIVFALEASKKVNYGWSWDGVFWFLMAYYSGRNLFERMNPHE